MRAAEVYEAGILIFYFQPLLGIARAQGLSGCNKYNMSAQHIMAHKGTE